MRPAPPPQPTSARSPQADVNTLYNQGFEIADHTITHRRPQTWWNHATYDDYASEVAGQKHILNRFGGVPTTEIRGFRAPFLAIGGDKYYRAINDSVRVNGDVGYDSSEIQLPSASFQPMWMHTLDHNPVTGIPAEYTCKNTPPTSCPNISSAWAGLWEFPVVDFKTQAGGACAQPDQRGCEWFNMSPDEVAAEFMYNFKSHSTGNKSPFGVYMHATFFDANVHGNGTTLLDGFDLFLSQIMALENVYVVTVDQALQWMKQPTELKDLKTFEPFKCDVVPKVPATPCTRGAGGTSCPYQAPVYSNTTGTSGDQPHWMTICVEPCPQYFPWVTNPDGTRPNL